VVEAVAPLAPHAFLVLPQPFSLSTPDVYREADRLGLARPAEDLAARLVALRAALTAGPLRSGLMVNDLQPAALSLRPTIERALDDALYAGSEHVIVSGSGPTVLGLFWGEGAQARASAAVAALAGRYPGATTAVPVDASFGIPHPA
jgi:4-diphosphocytidyl-2-C-methyl-D-erythritol kinase